MFSTFASVPSRPSSPDVHREVQNLLDVQGITFGTLVANALRDKTTTLGTTVVRELPNILESLRPHLDEDEESRVLLSEFFASIVSSELSRFERDDNEASWSLPATSLSTERLTKFNLKEMGKKISSETPALSSFLHRICGGKKLDDCEMDVDEKSEVEDELEFGTERRQKASPAQLLEIRKVTITSIILNTRNQKYNAFQVTIGIFLHSTHTPDRVISALHHAGVSISSSSILRAIKSMSAKTIELLAELGEVLLLVYAYDNFDIQQKPLTPTLENNVDTLRHLTSALVFPFQHGVVPEDLRVSEALWELDGFNDKSGASKIYTKSEMWSRILPRYSKLLYDGSEQPEVDHHHEFRVWLFLHDLIENGPEYFQKFQTELSLPSPIEEPIPVEKTRIIPLQSMDVSNSTVTGNIDTILKLLEQTGLGEYESPTPTIPLDSRVLLFHGDLGTGDRINSARQRRSIEASPRDRLQYVVFIMGLFHTKMACAETIWRTFLKEPKARPHNTSFYSDLKILRPRDSSSLSSTFKFRPIHDAIRYIGTCRRLDCMRVIAQEDQYPSLQSFADSKPSWNSIQALAQRAIQHFVLTPNELKLMDDKEPEERDEQLENSMGFHIYSALYEEMSHAMDHGDIGRVEMCLIAWAPLFEAAGKKRYAHHTIKLVHDLNYVFEARMSRAIRMHILINPTGQEGKFRAVDWVVELLNLYTKHKHSGSYSNKTVENILKESPLVEAYRQLEKIIENNFCTVRKTSRHQGPKMKRTFGELLAMMERNNTHVKRPGRESEFGVNRNWEKGIESIQQTMKRVGAGVSRENNANTQQEELEATEDGPDLDEEDLMLDND